MMRKSNGFTLIELMVAIAIFAIMVSVALPSFMNQRRQTMLRDAISMIRGDLEMARSQAIRENGPVAVLIREDGYGIFVDNGADGGIKENWVRDGGEKQLCTRNLSNGLKIDLNQVTFDGKRTQFNGRGYVGNAGVLVVVDADGKSATLDMNNRFGRISAH
jgi:prepilin-type N-terminal cleavage/methylation domain-containing protein